MAEGGMLDVSDAARAWGVSERSVRNYCAQGRVPGAELWGKRWLIPRGASKPLRKNARTDVPRTLADVLDRERREGVHGGIYHAVQVDLTYNSNHIEGSTLTHEQTRFIFETSTVGLGKGVVRVDDIVETVNHFRAIDAVIERSSSRISTRLIKGLHRTLKAGTRDAQLDWFRVGDWKAFPNEVGGRETVAPEDVDRAMRDLVAGYEQSVRGSATEKSLDDLLEFHVRFERIHPFQDGNGRVGRLLLFKECLRWGIVPFIISDDLKLFYYRGLSQWDVERGYLRDTCLTAQERFRERLAYFRIDV